MKMNKLTMAALALAAIGFSSTAASAATVNVGLQDLVLGFQVPSGTGASTNLEVDLGSFSLFTPTATLTLAQLSVNDLTSVYGSNWASVVNWSVAGSTTSLGANAFYATSTTSIKTNSGLSGPSGNIITFTAGLNNQTSTANSTTSATIGDSSTAASAIPSSYTSTEQGNGFTFIPNAEQIGAGTNELYSFTQQNKVGSGKTAAFPPATDLGTFALSSTGVLTYTGINAAAVPEPSAYALGICAVLLFIVLRRRHSVV